MTTRNGPTLAIVGDCAGCEHLARGVRDPVLRGTHTACTHPSRADGGTIFAHSRGKTPMPSWCPRLSAARLALLADLARTVCRQCGAIVEPEPERECYAVPTCYACLPPPPPLHVVPLPPMAGDAREVASTGDRRETCFVKGDSLDGDDVCDCRGNSATPDDACACVVDPGETVKPGEHPICVNCGAEVYDHAGKGDHHD